MLHIQHLVCLANQFNFSSSASVLVSFLPCYLTNISPSGHFESYWETQNAIIGHYENRKTQKEQLRSNISYILYVGNVSL
jgi:hypothetical protein